VRFLTVVPWTFSKLVPRGVREQGATTRVLFQISLENPLCQTNGGFRQPNKHDIFRFGQSRGEFFLIGDHHGRKDWNVFA